MNNPQYNLFPHEVQKMPYKLVTPESTFRDVIAVIFTFASVFIFSLFSLPGFSVDYGIYLGGYVKALALCIILSLAVFYVKSANKSFNRLSAFYVVCSASLILPYFFTNNNQSYALPLFAYLVGALCVSKTESLTVKRDSYRYFMQEVSDILLTPLKNILLPVKSLFKSIRIRRNKKLSDVFIGLVLSLPVIAVLFALLASGDAAFNNVTVGAFDRILEAIFDFIDKFFEDLFFSVQAGLLTLVFAPLVFSSLFCFRHGVQKELKLNSYGKNKAVRRPVTENVAIGFFVAVCALYVIYLFTQLSYFFGAFSGGIPLAVNMSLAEYARRGFFEMSAIAVINLSLIAFGVLFVKRREDGKISRLFKAIFSFLCAFTALLVITAVSKMALYITELGLTHTRILVCVADLLILSTIVCVFIKLHKERFPYMKIIVSLCCAVLSLYALFGDSALIATFNTNAYLKGYHTEIDIHTIRCETDNYHTVKSLHKIALTGDNNTSISAKYWAGGCVLFASDYSIEGKLEMSTLKNFLTTDSVSDFLFWEYVRDNGDFFMECLEVYRTYYHDPYRDTYYPDI